ELHEQREDFAAARPFRREALDSLTKLRGKTHWEVTDARQALADLDHLARLDRGQRQKLAEAVRLEQQANQLSGARKYREAVPLAERVVAARREVLGAEHPGTASALNGLGVLYDFLDDYARARPLYEQAAEVRKRTLGGSHPEYAISLHNLG